VSFKDIATPYARMGIPVFPLLPGEKVPPASMGSWPDRATTDEARILAWDAENPTYNCALVAKNDGFLVLEFDIQRGMKAAAQEMGQEVPKTRTHISGKQRGHFVFRQTDRSRALGNRSANLPEGGEWFSFRQHNRYVVGPGSIHPNGKPYKVAIGGDIDPIPVPDWICDWVDRHTTPDGVARPNNRVPVDDDFDFDDLMRHYGIGILGERNNWHITEVCPIAGYRHEHSVFTGFYYDGEYLGWKCFAQGCEGSRMTIGSVLRHLNESHEPYPKRIWPEREIDLDVDWVEVHDEEAEVETQPEKCYHQNCNCGLEHVETSLSPERRAALDADLKELSEEKEKTTGTAVITADEPEEIIDEASGVKYPELRFPYDALPPGRLKDLVDHACRGGLSPGLVCPAILTLASSIPVHDKMESARINAYACLLAMVGAGKDTAIDRAIAMLGLAGGRQFTAYTPSGERSLSNLLGDKPEKRGSDKRIPGPKRHCIVTYEIEDTMAKSRGETSSLLQALQWMYDHNDKVFSDSRSSSIQSMDCRLSWLTALPVGEGEIDEETFRRVFGEGTSHGLISRMWFGFAEEKFDRRKSRHWQPPAVSSTSSTIEVFGVELKQEETHSVLEQLSRSRVEGFAPGVETLYENWDPGKDWSGRDTYHVLKIAVLVALVNGHAKIELADWNFAVAFMEWQGRIRNTFASGRARKVDPGQFNETIIREMEKRTAKLKKAGTSDKKRTLIVEEKGKKLYFVRWKAMVRDGRWYKYGMDAEKTIDTLVRMGSLAYLVETDGEKEVANKRWVRLT
jgi:hypothetical protein